MWHILKTSWREKSDMKFQSLSTGSWKKAAPKKNSVAFQKRTPEPPYERHWFLDTGGTKSSETRSHRIGLVFKQKPAPLQTGVCWKWHSFQGCIHAAERASWGFIFRCRHQRRGRLFVPAGLGPSTRQNSPGAVPWVGARGRYIDAHRRGTGCGMFVHFFSLNRFWF